MFKKHISQISAVVVLAVIGLLSQSGQAEQSSKTSFGFSDYDSVLKTFVNEKAMVNYRKLKSQRRQLDAPGNRVRNTSEGVR